MKPHRHHYVAAGDSLAYPGELVRFVCVHCGRVQLRFAEERVEVGA